MSTEKDKKVINASNTYDRGEKRSLRFEKPPQTQLEKLDQVLGLAKEKKEDDKEV